MTKPTACQKACAVLARLAPSPPAAMILAACLGVLSLADYRTGELAGASMGTTPALSELARSDDRRDRSWIGRSCSIRAAIPEAGSCEAPVAESAARGQTCDDADDILNAFATLTGTCDAPVLTAATPPVQGTEPARGSALAKLLIGFPAVGECRLQAGDDGIHTGVCTEPEAVADSTPVDIEVDIATCEVDDTGELMGPMLPVSCEHAHRRGQPAAKRGDDCDHTLPFDPIAETRLVHAKPEEPATGDNAFREFLASQHELHTVSYVREVSHRIRSGETISEVLDAAGIMPGEVSEWVRATQEVYDLDRIYAGQALSLSVDMRSSQLRHLALEIDPRSVLVATREDDEGVVVRREKIPYETALRVVEAEIASSLYMAAVSQGIPDRIISDMAEILGWELNFARDLRPGARFRVVYEELTRVGSTASRPGRVVAVEVENRGKRHEGFYFSLPDGTYGAYYDREGRGLGRYFLRYPVAFSRISSGFSKRRFHPVLKTNRPHYGVDFAAPTGTPVKAIAGGTVLKAGWYGGNGRFIKLRHDPIYESGYAHLSRIEDGIEPGTRVKKGQVIGYVGATGLATGPHLHLALYKSGRYIDPLTSELPRARPLSGTELASFRATVDAIDRAYAEAGTSEERLASVSPSAGRE